MTKKVIKNEIFTKALKKEPGLSFLGKLIKRFPDAEIYLVGGAVRDIILKRKTKDYDFVVINVQAKALKNFLKKIGKVNLVGKTFGVFKFIPKKSRIEAIDIALPRTEHSLAFKGGYKDFKIKSDPKLPIEKDLERRDFTINALAFGIKNKKLIDNHTGISDLAAEKIRTVGKAETRFKEDYSRMLRALRFACQLNFEIEEKTWQAIKNLINYLKGKTVPREVLTKELLKTFKSDPVKAFDFLDTSGVFKSLLPEIEKMKNVPQPNEFHSEGDVFVHTRLALEKLYSPEFLKIIPDKKHDLEVILGMLFHDIGKPPTLKLPEKDSVDRIRFDGHDQIGVKITEKIIGRLKLESSGEIKKENVIWLVQKHMLLIHADVSKIKASTIEKYFFNPRMPGLKLLKVILADILASIPKGKKSFTQGLIDMLKRIEELKKLDKIKKSLPKPIINGYDIMNKFQLKPGPQIGELLKVTREQQLIKKIKTKEQAINFLKKYLNASKTKSNKRRGKKTA